ncbi:MAG: hypothetical protein V9G13_12035 [Marmoricola sp.]
MLSQAPTALAKVTGSAAAMMPRPLRAGVVRRTVAVRAGPTNLLQKESSREVIPGVGVSVNEVIALTLDQVRIVDPAADPTADQWPAARQGLTPSARPDRRGSDGRVAGRVLA